MLSTSDTIRVSGLKEAADGLRQLGRKDARRIVRKGLRAGAKITVAAEREEAPVRTAKLRKALRVSGVRPPAKGVIAVAAAESSKPFNKFYPIFVVRGFTTRAKDGRKVAPNDYIARAYDRTAAAALNAAVTLITDQLTAGF